MGRRILITGANRGIGLELTKLLIHNGDQVYGSARFTNADNLRDLQPAGIVRLDYGDLHSIANAAAKMKRNVSGLDMLINCAGIDARALGHKDPRGPFDMDVDVYTELVRINVGGPIELTRSLLPLLRKGTDPFVINISSQLASMQVAATKGRDTPYCVSKAALNMWSVKTAAKLRPEGIGVAMMHPGWVRTDMGGAGGNMSVFESASGIVATLNKLTFADTGRFIRWDGSDHPW